MRLKGLLIARASVLASALGSAVMAQEPQRPYVQIAEIDIDPTQLDAYKATVQDHIEAAVRIEPGVLGLYAVSDTSNPTRITVFEMCRDVDAYRTHLEAEHFKTYKATTARMVTALKLIPTTPIMLGGKK
jgi:quinol monooxygenase YgiN